MQIGDTMYEARWGDVNRVKLIACEGDTAVVKRGDDVYTLPVESLRTTKRAATASALKQRARSLKSYVESLNKAAAEVQKKLAACIQAIEVADDE